MPYARLLFAFFLVHCSSTPATSDGGVDASADGNASCVTPKVSCGGQCVDTKTDNANCGGCGLACPTGESCCGASCSSDSQCSITVTSVSSAHGYMSGGDYV